MNFKNHIALALALALALTIHAQDGINTPYSQYGFGWSNLPCNQPAAAALGGTVVNRSGNNIVNPFNPASYAWIEPESFVFDMGFGTTIARQSDPQASFTDGDAALSHLSVAFPLTKWWKTSLSLLPQSDMGYSTTQTAPLTGIDSGQVRTNYSGQGGVTRFVWGHAFNLVPGRLSAGFNANYHYGYISRDIIYEFSAPDSLPQYMNVARQKVTFLRNFTFDFGLQYRQPLGKDYRLDAGLTLAAPRTMQVEDHAIVRTFVTYGSGGVEYRDTIFPNPGENPQYVSTVEVPARLGLGLALQRESKWRVALDLAYAPYSGVRYTDGNSQLMGATSVVYGDNVRASLGLQLLGNPDASRYVRRITYSAGMHYEQGKLRLALSGSADAHCLNEWGLGLGATLPMRKGKSLLTISGAYSSFGTLDPLRQQAFTIGISVSSCESWFVKKKYN